MVVQVETNFAPLKFHIYLKFHSKKAATIHLHGQIRWALVQIKI